MLFTKLSPVQAAVDSGLPGDDGVVEPSGDATVSCAMSLAELEAALGDNHVDNMFSLPQPVKQVVRVNFNTLLLNSVHGSLGKA